MWSNTYWHAQLLPREENGNPLLYSCLEDSMDTGVLEGLQFMGSKRVRCDWQTHTHKHTHSCSAVSESLWLQRLQPTRLVFDPLPLLHGIVAARTLEWVPFPPLGNLPDPGLNLSLLHSKQILYCCTNKVAP